MKLIRLEVRHEESPLPSVPRATEGAERVCDAPTAGVAGDQWRSRLEWARDEWLAEHAIDFSDEANRAARLPAHTPVRALPEQQLLAYERHREASELGRVFTIANRLHDHLDAVVMVGSAATCAATRALFAACCDPYHNELSRAARGSKPRLYFADGGWDNDHLRSLIERVQVGGYGDTPAERRWALMAVDDACSSHAERSMANLLRRCQAELPPGGLADGLPELATRVDQRGERHVSAAVADWDQTLVAPATAAGCFNALTPATTLPAAFLGLDCIQLLVGAAAVNEQFAATPFADNLVLRYVAALARQPANDASRACAHRRPTARPLIVCPPALRPLAGLLASLSGGSRAIEPDGPPPVDQLAECLRPQEAATRQCLDGSGAGVVVLDVDAVRTDPLRCRLLENAIGPPADFPAHQKRQSESLRARFTERGIPVSRLVLGEINTHGLGQLIQLHYLAGQIRAKLAGAG